MRKPRSMVYVRPGKDVTLYVPSDTPQDVCDYLNSLKEQGMFSSGVIEIITNYVQGHPELKIQSPGESSHEIAEPQPARVNPLHTEALKSVSSFFDSDEKTWPEEKVETVHEAQPAVKHRLSLSEIFSQAKKNSLDKL